MKIEKVLSVFKEKPYLVDMGANKIANQLKCDVKLVREARSIFRSGIKNINVKSEAKDMKILILDIETAPMQAFVWSRWKQNIYLDQTISEWFMLCWSAKFVGSNEVLSDRVSSSEVLNEDDKRISTSLWNVVNEADVVVAHNGKRFDIPRINTRFLLNGLPPTNQYMQIDTKEVAAKQFGFSSNKLDALAIYFGFSRKLDTDFNLWKKCMSGDDEALSYMSTYCNGDILLLEKIYLKLKPYIKNHPNYELFIDSDKPACPNCGSNNIHESGFYYTGVAKYKTFRCECGAVSRSRKSEKTNAKLTNNIR